ncbi:MAG: DivIVA domain-containing protein [Acidimicrobiales bacterium]
MRLRQRNGEVRPEKAEQGDAPAERTPSGGERRARQLEPGPRPRVERPSFERVRKGYDPEQVDRCLDEFEREQASLRRSLELANQRIEELVVQVALIDDREREVERVEAQARRQAQDATDLARKEAEQILAAARKATDLMLAEGRATLAKEDAELDRLRFAIAAETIELKEIEARMTKAHGVSRVTALLFDIVEGPDGIGPFSDAAGTLVEFARLLRRSGRSEQPALPPAPIDLRDAAPAAPADEAPLERSRRVS